MPLILPQTIHDPSSGATIPSTWGDGVNAAIDYLGATKPRARVFNSANISIADNTATALTFNSERYDVGGCHSTVSNTSRLTVPTGEGGLYTGGTNVRWAGNATGLRQVAVRLNGATYIAIDQSVMGTTANIMVPILFEYVLAAGDYLEVIVLQTSGVALNIEVAGNYSPEFWWRWVASI